MGAFFKRSPCYSVVFLLHLAITSSRQDRAIKVLGELDLLLQNESLSVALNGVHFVLDQVDELLDVKTGEEIPGELVHALDKLGTRFDLGQSPTASFVRGNVAMFVADSTPWLGLRGVRITAPGDEILDENAFHIITAQDADALHLTTDINEAAILLPHSATRIQRRISVVAFMNDRPFNDHSCQLNSKVLSVSVQNYNSFEDDEVIQIYLNPWRREHRRNQSRTCARWHFNEDGSGFWSQEGCTFTKAAHPIMLDLCQCNHLTHLAEILVHKDVFSETNENMLVIVSIIGCFFSLFGIVMIALTAILFKTWRQNNSNKIWLNLCLAVFILDVCFLLTVFVNFDEHITFCVVVGVSLHYAVLATFCWMLVISILSFRKLVLVFKSELPCKLLATALFAWGFPFLVIGILFAVNPYAYSARFEEMTPSGKFCYPKAQAFWAAVIAPIGVMWFINWVLYMTILRAMFVSKNKIRRHSSINDTLRGASVSFLLAFLCGIPWVFGFFAYNIVAAYLFSITVTFQGFILFLFFVLGNKKTRGLWTSMYRKSNKLKLVTSTDRCNRNSNTARFVSLNSTSTPSSPKPASCPLLSETKL